MNVIDTLANHHQLLSALKQLQAERARRLHDKPWTYRTNDGSAVTRDPVEFQACYRGSPASIYATTKEKILDLVGALNYADDLHYEQRIAEVQEEVRAILTSAMLGGEE